MAFHIGSLINPKMMLKVIKNEAIHRQKVVIIYNYLYKFSLERLQHLLNNECMMILLILYLESNGYSRIHMSPNMIRFRHAYYEAMATMVK